ncbi:two-component regulator propeller domain-containing protein [Reichenbachiella sp. 5M10]|uniref:ligand-binding sensor domain-containing protein n=1 Tax=Reichenbachiella sp. 5M10 TaxID=1889772 RepID=UPI001304263D|nr:two-component regulator propeller domain-containing protein [Reichenbachiella sp. 5M10]
MQVAVCGNVRSSDLSAPKLDFHHIDGLYNNQITAFCQDDKGYIWIGTNNGLHRYDGEKYRLFLNNGDSSSLNSSRVKCLLEDSKGMFWMGATDGLCRYVSETDKFENLNVEERYFPELSYPNVIMDLVEDTVLRQLWVASLSEGLLVYDYETNRLTPFFAKGEETPLANYPLHSLALRALALDVQRHQLWIGHNAKGLNYLDLKTNQVYNLPLRDQNGQDVQSIVALELIDADHLWVGTAEDGVFEVDLSQGSPAVGRQMVHMAGQKYSLRNNFITSIYLDREGHVWVCNDNGGLHRYDSLVEGFYNYVPDNSPNSITNMSIRCVYQDRQNRLWVGTALEGVDVVDPYLNKFYHIRKTHAKSLSLSNNIIRDFHEDERGRIWIATDGGGINVYDPNNESVELIRWDDHIETSLSSDAVLTMLDIGESQLMVGTWNGGINIIDTETFEVKRFLPEKTALNSVFELIQDKDGMIWATGFACGVQRIDMSSGEVQSYRYDRQNPNSLKSDLTFALYEDSRGDIWVGGEASGLYLLRYENKNRGYFEPLQFNDDESFDIANDWVAQIIEGKDRRIYCATSSGLIRVDSETMEFERVLEEKLPASDIRSIVQDDRGDFWFATIRGLSKYLVESDSVVNYSSRDGLQQGKFTKNTFYKSRTGRIYVGGTEGVNYFDPAQMPFNSFAPEVYISGLKLFNKKVLPGDSTGLIAQHLSTVDEVVFDSDQWQFTIGYVALNYTRPEYTTYAYQLEGMDNRWNYVGHQTEATYSHLPYGSYVFKVKAANNDGVWQETPASIRIVILPPWWLKWWVIVLEVIGVALVVYLIVRWRTLNLYRRERRLKNMVKERTALLSEKNMELEGLNKAIMDQADELKAYNDALNEMNEKLEELVQIRTHEIREKNEKLTKFAFDNAHRVRGPLTRIMGMIALVKKTSSEEKKFWMDKIEESSYEMDEITKSMGSEIEEHLKEE